MPGLSGIPLTRGGARRRAAAISTTEELTPARQTDDLAALVTRAQAGEDAAFDALYARTVGRIYAVCLRLCADRAEAERLTQDTFVQAWQRMKSFRGDSRFTSWLHRIAVNTVLMDRRGAGRREARVRGADDDELSRVADRPRALELHLDLERAIAALPSGARTALVLHDIEGYTHQEIASMMGLAAGTIKAQLHRARQLLQQKLEP
jgi:RNA polymerase sigma factor (sigma-70 family)